MPILAAGSTEGKNDINARLGHLDLGVDLRTQRPTPGRIAAGLERLLADETFRDNVVRLGLEFDRAMTRSRSSTAGWPTTPLGR